MSKTRLLVSGFDRLSDRVHLHRPHANSAEPESILILCTWMDASPKLIAKYAQEYVSHFPSSTILLITTHYKAMFLNRSKDIDDLSPAIEYLVEHASKDQCRLNGAIYSNGGVSALTTIAKAYRADTGKPLNVQRLILDSCPAPTYLSGAHGAFSSLVPKSFRKFPQSILFDALLWLFLYLWYAIVTLTGRPNPISVLRADINDPSLLKTGGRRTYIYSKEDIISHYHGPETSEKEAASRGWKTRMVISEGTKHVAHALGDRHRYWEVVRETLES